MTRTIALIFLIIVPFVGSNATTNNETSGSTASPTIHCDLTNKAKAGDAAAVRKMIDANCALEVTDIYNTNPLMYAVRYDHTSVVWLLTQAGANPNVKYLRDPVLTRAARHGEFEIARILIEAGADIDAKSDTFYETALHIASGLGYADIVQLLIDNKANINALDWSNRNTLRYAVGNGRTEAIRILVKAGANIHAVDSEGKTLLHNTTMYHIPDMNIYMPSIRFSSPPWDWDTKRRAKAIEDKESRLADAAQALIERGAKINAKDNVTVTWENGLKVRRENLWTPLHYAARNNRPRIIRRLADAGALLNPKDAKGNTPLHVASKHGRVEAVRTLIEVGADDRVKNTAGLRANKVSDDNTIRAMIENPGIHWPFKAYAVGNVSTENTDTTMRILCDDSKDCRVHLNCFDEDGSEFQGWIGDLEKRRGKTTIGSITKKTTLSLSSSELKTLVDATDDTGALDCALHSNRRVTVQVWSIAGSGKSNMTAYRLSENHDTYEATSVRFYYGDTSIPHIHFRCLADKNEKCRDTKFECVDDMAAPRPTISAGVVQRLHVYTVAGSDSDSDSDSTIISTGTSAGTSISTSTSSASAGTNTSTDTSSNTDTANHRIPATAKGWHSCKASSSEPFMVYVNDSITKGNSNFTGNSTAISME